jgi:hypothetical protein
MANGDRKGFSRIFIFCIIALFAGIGLHFYSSYQARQQAERDYPGLLRD